MNKRNSFWGIILIFIGTSAILRQVFNIRIFSMETFWPVFVLAPGLIFEFSYFTSRRNPGLLVPGGVLTVIGSLFFFETLTSWKFAGYTWPVYVLAPAFGLFQLYIFSERKKGNHGLLIPVFILTTVGAFSLITSIFGNIFYWINSSLVLPIALILLGVFILFKNYIGPRD